MERLSSNDIYAQLVADNCMQELIKAEERKRPGKKDRKKQKKRDEG